MEQPIPEVDLPSVVHPPQSQTQYLPVYKIHFVYHATRGADITWKPQEDISWFATYPIIPRVGDCVGIGSYWFRVDEVFLYSVEQSVNEVPALINCSYYGPGQSSTT